MKAFTTLRTIAFGLTIAVTACSGEINEDDKLGNTNEPGLELDWINYSATDKVAEQHGIHVWEQGATADGRFIRTYAMDEHGARLYEFRLALNQADEPTGTLSVFKGTGELVHEMDMSNEQCGAAPKEIKALVGAMISDAAAKNPGSESPYLSFRCIVCWLGHGFCAAGCVSCVAAPNPWSCGGCVTCVLGYMYEGDWCLASCES